MKLVLQRASREILGSYCKQVVGDRENVVWKWNFAFVQSVFNYFRSPGEQMCGLSSGAQVIHTTAKQVISCLGKNENGCQMNKNVCNDKDIGFNGAETNCRIAHILGILYTDEQLQHR